MSRKTINIQKQTREKLKKCKKEDTERYAQVIDRLLTKYEKEVINNG